MEWGWGVFEGDFIESLRNVPLKSLVISPISPCLTVSLSEPSNPFGGSSAISSFILHIPHPEEINLDAD